MSKRSRPAQRKPAVTPEPVKRSRAIPITTVLIVLIAGGLVAAEAVRRSRAASNATAGAVVDNTQKSCCDKIPSRFASLTAATQGAHAGMVWIPGGEFTMGTDAPDVYPQERPAHRVKISGFWMD